MSHCESYGCQNNPIMGYPGKKFRCCAEHAGPDMGLICGYKNCRQKAVFIIGNKYSCPNHVFIYEMNSDYVAKRIREHKIPDQYAFQKVDVNDDEEIFEIHIEGFLNYVKKKEDGNLGNVAPKKSRRIIEDD